MPTSADFSADAYLNEMGITTTWCISGQVNNAFATENRANRARHQRGHQRLPRRPVPGIDDDLAAENNNCAGGLNELQDDVELFTFFMATWRRAPRGIDNSTAAASRCSTARAATAATVGRRHFVSTTDGAQRIAFQPFSDFLVHDMGTLGDGIGNDGDSVAVTRRMRTAPLWGLRFRNKQAARRAHLQHRRAPSQAHDGQGAAARKHSTPPPRRRGTTCCCS